MTIKELKEKINFRQPKYMLPAIIYIPLIIALYFLIDLFHVETAEIPDKTKQTTEYLNPTIPEAQLRDDGIGGKYENMAKSYGNIADLTAVDVIDREDPQESKEEYESKYSDNDIALLDHEEQTKGVAAQGASNRTREEEALKELEKALAEARLKGNQSVGGNSPQNSPDISGEKGDDPKQIEMKGSIAEDSKKVSVPSDSEKPQELVKKIKTTSDYFNTIASNQMEAKLIKAIIDEDVKASDGTRVRLRLLDDVEIGDHVVRQGTYLYATMSGFSSQRVKGSITSLMVDDELIKVSLSLYDTDGMEGLYVPGSQFRETTKDVASGAAQSNISMSTSGGNTLTQWGMQTAQNAYQKTSNAISKAIKKNTAKLKYGTFVYIVNSKDIKNN